MPRNQRETTRIIGRGKKTRSAGLIVAPPSNDEIIVTVHPSCPLKSGGYVAPGNGPFDTMPLSSRELDICHNKCGKACVL